MLTPVCLLTRVNINTGKPMRVNMSASVVFTIVMRCSDGVRITQRRGGQGLCPSRSNSEGGCSAGVLTARRRGGPGLHLDRERRGAGGREYALLQGAHPLAWTRPLLPTRHGQRLARRLRKLLIKIALLFKQHSYNKSSCKMRNSATLVSNA